MKQFVHTGTLPTGKLNHICDVPGVLVGHQTIIQEDIRTGVTAILPHNRNLFLEKVTGNCFVMNGYGKSIGLMQIEELGQIETPILLTNTFAVGRVTDGLVHYLLDKNKEIGKKQGTINPVVLECNDGRLNNIRKIMITEADVRQAIASASTNSHQGSIGAGTGMICHGLKGGIGSSSRIIPIEGINYTLGVLVNSNFGHSSSRDLIVNGDPIGRQIAKERGVADQGSIIVVVATDIGLDANQLKRIIKRAAIGIGRTGSYIGHGSGDVFVGFTIANTFKNKKAFHTMNVLDNQYINLLFQGVVEATEEAIYQSMLASPAMDGYLTSVDSLTKWINQHD